MKTAKWNLRNLQKYDLLGVKKCPKYNFCCKENSLKVDFFLVIKTSIHIYRQYFMKKFNS